jgi:hypothetical protein
MQDQVTDYNGDGQEQVVSNGNRCKANEASWAESCEKIKKSK